MLISIVIMCVWCGVSQLCAQQAAELEIQRLEELQREEACDRQERLEKARLRGNHALRREQHTQVELWLVSSDSRCSRVRFNGDSDAFLSRASVGSCTAAL